MNLKIKGIIKKGLVVCLGIALIMSNGAIKANAAEDLKPGDVAVDKNAKLVDGTEDNYIVTNTVEGKNVVLSSGPVDVVLVVDNSGSMEGSRMTNAKLAAKEFVNKLLFDGSQIQVGIIAFNGLAEEVPFTSDVSELNKFIDGMYANGVTNMQTALHSASAMKGREGVAKVVIFISDGAAYGTAVPADYDDDDLDIIHNADGSHKINVKNNTPTEFDYSKYQAFTEYISLTKECPTCHQIVTDNWVACQCLDTERAYYEADLLKNQGIQIYTVGYQLSGAEEEVLKNIQNSGYVNASDVTDIQVILDNLASDILANAGTKAIVKETLGDAFEYVDGSIVASIGDVNYDPETKTFTWDIGIIKEEDTITLQYTVKLSEEAKKKDGLYDINTNSNLSYVDYLGVNKVIGFPGYSVKVTGNETEEVSDENNQSTTTIPENKKDSENKKDKKKDVNPKTGDNSVINGELFILASSLLLIASISLVLLKKRENNN